MAIGEVVGIANQSSSEVVSELSNMVTWLQAVGAIVLLWLIFHIASFIVNWKRNKRIDEIQEKLIKMDRKLTHALGKKK